MDGRRFDELSRAASSSRRSVLANLAAAIGAALLARFAPGVAVGKKRRKKKEKKKGPTCTGCYVGDDCQPGNVFNACGERGADCENCRDRFLECQSRGLGKGGACICTTPSCQRLDSQGRGGCCTALNAATGTCESGTTDTACGERGNQCVNCNARAKRCDAATRDCCIAANDRGCGENDPCCGGSSCVGGRCIPGSSCSRAGGPCGSGQRCCDGQVLECRSGTCCALTFGFCQVDGDCCDASHTCDGTSCFPPPE